MALSALKASPEFEGAGSPTPAALPADQPASPSPAWARANPDHFLQFLFVSPRPCAALDEMLRQA